MARDDWRLRIELPEDRARGLAAQLGLVDTDADELARDLRDRRLAVTHDDGLVFVYAGSSLALEQARQIVERELDGAPATVTAEHWLADEERWDDESAGPDPDEQLAAEGYAPWEVRIPCRDHATARELADRLEGEGYGVVRRWTLVIAGCNSKAQAQELAARVRGEVEPGGELVWEAAPTNPFALFGGLGSSGTPI